MSVFVICMYVCMYKRQRHSYRENEDVIDKESKGGCVKSPCKRKNTKKHKIKKKFKLGFFDTPYLLSGIETQTYPPELPTDYLIYNRKGYY